MIGQWLTHGGSIRRKRSEFKGGIFAKSPYTAYDESVMDFPSPPSLLAVTQFLFALGLLAAGYIRKENSRLFRYMLVAWVFALTQSFFLLFYSETPTPTGPIHNLMEGLGIWSFSFFLWSYDALEGWRFSLLTLILLLLIVLFLFLASLMELPLWLIYLLLGAAYLYLYGTKLRSHFQYFPYRTGDENYLLIVTALAMLGQFFLHNPTLHQDLSIYLGYALTGLYACLSIRLLNVHPNQALGAALFKERDKILLRIRVNPDLSLEIKPRKALHQEYASKLEEHEDLIQEYLQRNPEGGGAIIPNLPTKTAFLMREYTSPPSYQVTIRNETQTGFLLDTGTTHIMRRLFEYFPGQVFLCSGTGVIYDIYHVRHKTFHPLPSVGESIWDWFDEESWESKNLLTLSHRQTYVKAEKQKLAVTVEILPTGIGQGHYNYLVLVSQEKLRAQDSWQKTLSGMDVQLKWRPHPTLYLNQEGLTEALNEPFRRHFACLLPLEKIQPQHPRLLFSQDFWQKQKQYFKKILISKTLLEYEVFLESLTSEEPRLFHVIAEPLPSNHDLEGFLITYIPLTEIQAEMQKLKEAQKQQNSSPKENQALQEHLEQNSRIPLNSVFGMMELLGETSLDEEQKEYLRMLQTSIKDFLFMNNEILHQDPDNLLQTSKPESNSLSEIFAKTERILTPFFAPDKISLQWPREMPRLYAPPALLQSFLFLLTQHLLSLPGHQDMAVSFRRREELMSLIFTLRNPVEPEWKKLDLSSIKPYLEPLQASLNLSHRKEELNPGSGFLRCTLMDSEHR
jgi:signal transduction histidine kinase